LSNTPKQFLVPPRRRGRSDSAGRRRCPRLPRTLGRCCRVPRNGKKLTQSATGASSAASLREVGLRARRPVAKLSGAFARPGDRADDQTVLFQRPRASFRRFQTPFPISFQPQTPTTPPRPPSCERVPSSAGWNGVHKIRQNAAGELVSRVSVIRWMPTGHAGFPPDDPRFSPRKCRSARRRSTRCADFWPLRGGRLGLRASPSTTTGARPPWLETSSAERKRFPAEAPPRRAPPASPPVARPFSPSAPVEAALSRRLLRATGPKRNPVVALQPLPGLRCLVRNHPLAGIFQRASRMGSVGAR